MIIWRQPSLLQTVTDQKQPENVEYLKYLGSFLTNYARCAREIKPSVAMAKAVFSRKKATKLDLNLRTEASKLLHLEHGFVWC